MPQYDSFQFDNNYDPQTGFVRVRYGFQKAVLETELNEMQKIEQENRSSLIRKSVPSGFVNLNSNNLDSSVAVVCNPNNKTNAIALAPSRLFINGYEVYVEGNEVVNGQNGYLTINFTAPPTSLYRTDFAFLEFWFQELTSESTVNQFGYVDGTILPNTMIDSRLNAETSRRIALRWRVRITEDQDFNKWPSGFGFNSDTDFSPNYAQGAMNAPVDNLDYVFRSATNSAFEGLPFFGDNGLYVAGLPTSSTISTDLGIVDGYVFAVPLMRVNRRNSGAYSIQNPNGADEWINSSSVSSHPAGLFYNVFANTDIIDLRNSVSFKTRNSNIMLDNTLKELVIGNLQSSQRETMKRIQFGVSELSNTTNVIFTASLDNSLLDNNGNNPTVIGGPATYLMGANSSGLVLNGQTSVSYNLTGFNKNSGAIDCFVKPFWDGSDSVASQEIWSVIDPGTSTKAFELAKSGSQLVLTNRMDNSGTISSEIVTSIDLINAATLKSKKLHHIRVTWDYSAKTIQVWIDGINVGTNNYELTSLNPSVLKLGEIETYDSSLFYTNTVIDEVVVYNVLQSSASSQLTEDFIEGKASLYSSFGGFLNGSADNGFEQTNFVEIVQTVNGATSFSISTIDQCLVANDVVPVVYNSTGAQYSGTWSGLGTSNATFNLTATPSSGTTFTGENVYVQYNILVPAGNGIFEMPTTVLKAQLNGQEASFNVVGAGPRQVNLLNPNVTLGNTDTAFDYNTTSRTTDQCFARLLYYYIQGNGQNKYQIPSTLYGYNVIGIRYVSLPYNSIEKTTTTGPLTFEIDFTNALIAGQVAEIHVLLGGMTFDYQTYTKNIVYNTLNTDTLTAVAPGNTDTFTLALDTAHGYNTIVSSAAMVTSESGSGSSNTAFYAFVNGTLTELLSVSGFGTPFLTVKFSSTPLINQTIEIPVLATYSPQKDDIVSVWIKEIPYQGVLSNSPQTLNRISDWVPFVTTLSSGNFIMNAAPLPPTSINNAFNRLPGGGTFTSLLTSEEIDLKTDNFTDYNGTTVNKHFITFKNVRNATVSNSLDHYFNELDPNFVIKKDKSQYQDGKLDSPFNSYGFFLPDTSNPIHKYAGAACLVSNSNGEILLFVFGHAHGFASSTSTVSKPIYGDLFYLDGRPITLTE